MNVPKGMREFNLELAQQAHNLCTRDGRPAKFIAYVPEAVKGDRLIVLINGTVYGYHENGMWRDIPDENHNLFLAPLGYVDSLPVFAGDKLVQDYHPHKEITVEVNHTNFSAYKWPSKAPVVETRMSEDEFFPALQNAPLGDIYTVVANKAIERAILDGDVIPTRLFIKIAGTMYNKRVSRGTESFEEIAQKVLNDYLEGLK